MHPVVSWLLRLIGPALLIGFLLTSDLGLLWQIVQSADIVPIIWSLALMPPFIIFKSWRWIQIMRAMNLSLDLPTACVLYTVGVFYGAVTPGQAGDLLKAVYLRERGQPVAPALLSVVLDRLCDLIIMVAFGVIGVFALGRLLPSRELQQAIVIAMGIGLVAVTVLLAARGPRSWLLTTVLPRIAPRLRARLDQWNEQMHSLTLTPKLVAIVSAATVASVSFTFLRLWLLYLALDLSAVPLLVVIGSSALISVLQALPISIGGVGVRDVVLVATLAAYGYSQEQALTLSVLFLLINVEHIIVGFIFSLWFPIGRSGTIPS
ncbi:lysylphosphatidylglycerol synthase transmembrane domain-containing protein [Chloroflexus sp.]|uniref:lysylphosphatidylglycerol synthase transmembrane domain-containing protein n=1 Tax=Chloroflexus sp. TaxID=1904827 RepID=UPI00298EE3AB|nr:lysylphosphatidylglycerol synthase transmembrane domain-containing protein [Chloroflexus sp.]MCS6887394.1 flippase-like domain-containing protein [Chloroflexus sp.]MDW8403788.1 lysylphosphatidylglycerol synthase transmembrane domain-containing protein [Chloroflexus sp.]